MKIRKLELRRETLRELNADQLGGVVGGGIPSSPCSLTDNPLQCMTVRYCVTDDCPTASPGCYSSPGMPC